MIGDLSIGKVVNSLLSANSDLTTIVGDKIFPLVAPQDTTFPFIVYKRTEINPQFTKDIYTHDKITMEIVAASNKYTEAAQIADLIREAIENTRGIYDNISIRNIRLTGAYEDYFDENNAYAEDLVFEISTT